MYAQFEDEVKRTYYRGLTLIKFDNGEWGLASESMATGVYHWDMWLGTYDSFESMMTKADEIADRTNNLPHDWARAEKFFAK